MKKVAAVWIVLSLIWGSTWIFIKLGLRDLPPITFAGLRFLVAGLVLLVIVRCRRVLVPRDPRQLYWLAGTGIISITINYALVFWGETRIPSGLAAVLQAMIPVFGLLIAHHLLPTEPLSKRRLLGVLVGFAGVAVIFYDQTRIDGWAAVQGSFALLFSSLCIALGNVLVKSKLQHVDPAVIAACQMNFGFPPLLLAGWLWEGNPFALRWTMLAALSLLYLALVGSALAFLLYYWLVARVEVTKTMLISLVIPVVALLIGAVVAGERLTLSILAGSVTILIGIGIILRKERVTSMEEMREQ
ncbi:MAG: DMT family transporter [Blastocatellia bacterium]